MRGAVEVITIDLLILVVFRQPGIMTYACNPVTWRLGLLNGLRFLGAAVTCRSGVRTKFGANMVSTAESEFSRLGKEGRIGPGVETKQARTPASNCSEIAPVNREKFTARSNSTLYFCSEESTPLVG